MGCHKNFTFVRSIYRSALISTDQIHHQNFTPTKCIALCLAFVCWIGSMHESNGSHFSNID